MYQQGDICSTVPSFEAALLPCDPFFTLKAMRIVLKSSFDQFNHLTIIYIAGEDTLKRDTCSSFWVSDY